MQAVLFILVRLVLGCMLLMTALPWLRVGYWYVRICDFLRPQVIAATAASAGTLLILAWTDGWTWEGMVWLAVATFVIGWQASHIVKYTPLFRQQIADEKDPERTEISVAVVNLKFENTKKAAVLEQLTGLDVDLLLLIEIDAPWEQALRSLHATYPHRMGVIRDEGLGLQLWSRLPLDDQQVLHLVSDKRASVYASVRSKNCKPLRILGVHPLPPGLPDETRGSRHDSRIRDAELMLVAKRVAESPDAQWLVTGDFNDVAWSHTTRMFQRLSGLCDPRVGRGLYNTYHAGHWWLRFPIDQIFVSPTARVRTLSRFRPVGSDHFAMIARLSFEATAAVDETSAPDLPDHRDIDEAQELVAEGREDASKV